ncbi:MAG TPA: NAD(P)-binding domain-containing protein [Jiangellales bacterium]|nr:NAD(P)-binding domain-containing protein [Jiangellales bacterium]
MTDVAVIGAGSSGLAVLEALGRDGVEAEAFERGSRIGGMWRYGNDNGMSAAYASLRANVSRRRMQYPSLPMPASYGDFPSRTDMTAYLEAYASRRDLEDRITVGTTVDRLEPAPGGPGWVLQLDDGSTRRHRHVVVATGVFRAPRLPDDLSETDAELIHSHAYRTPDPYTGRRVLVVGGGQSAAEIATELSVVADRCLLAVRSPTHVVPRWIADEPYDIGDVEPYNRMPWPLLNRIVARRVRAELGPLPPQWPTPRRRILEGVPIVSSDLIPAVLSGAVSVTPAVQRLHGRRAHFADGSSEPVDAVVLATGYRVSLPFLDPRLLAAQGRRLPLYRRIVPPGLPGLFLAGFVDAPGGLLPVVETQAAWISAVVTGRLDLPTPDLMWRAIRRSERRTRQRFPGEPPDSIRCDPHAHRRLLRSDLTRVATGRHVLRPLRRAPSITAAM